MSINVEPILIDDEDLTAESYSFNPQKSDLNISTNIEFSTKAETMQIDNAKLKKKKNKDKDAMDVEIDKKSPKNKIEKKMKNKNVQDDLKSKDRDTYIKAVDNIDQNKEKVSEFKWIDHKNDENVIEINYIQDFLNQNKDKIIDYKALDIIELDPSQNGILKRLDVAGNMLSRINKYGRLNYENKSKNNLDDYDKNDVFIDDSDFDSSSSNRVPVGILESTIDDFKCIEGDINVYKNSKYHAKRSKYTVDLDNIKHSEKLKKPKTPKNIQEEVVNEGANKAAKKSGKDNENYLSKMDGKLAKKSGKDDSVKRKRIDNEIDEASKAIKQVKYTTEDNNPSNKLVASGDITY